MVPCYLMTIVLLAYWSYAALSVFSTPSFDSPDLITGESPTNLLLYGQAKTQSDRD